MRFHMEYGDTNFIGVVNAKEYNSFVSSDWELEMLMQHFSNEMKLGNVLVCQMDEYSWRVEVRIGKELTEKEFIRKVEGYINVTDNKLYLVDYDCLTMSAQFESCKVPDKNCSSYKIDIENGIYKVDIVQFYDFRKGERIGDYEKDILFNFTKVSEFKEVVDRVFWCTF